jgi:hypothetical protein
MREPIVGRGFVEHGGPGVPRRRTVAARAVGFPPSRPMIGEADHLHPVGQFHGLLHDRAPDPVPVEPVHGRFDSPESFAARIRSSQRARRRSRSSRSDSCPRVVLLANAVSRSPLESVNRRCPPGVGLFSTHHEPHPSGQPVKSSNPVISATQAPSLIAPSAS